MKVWTVNRTSYENAKEIKNGLYEDVAPIAVVRSRDRAVKQVLGYLNTDRAEIRRDLKNDGEDLSQYKDLTADDLKWEDCHVSYTNQMRWKLVHDDEYQVFVIAEHDLANF